MAAEAPGSVAVVGLGLIGASLCRALRERLPEVEVIGIARRPELAARAAAEGVCQRAGTDPGLLAGAELAVLCTPVDAMPEWLTACAGVDGLLVTDAGSTKAWISERGAAVLGDRFLGGHPMAGRERSGYDAAEAGLFEGCAWVLTPTGPGHLERFRTWAGAVEAIGADLEIVDPEVHDRAVAWISHLPLALSAALVRAATAAPEWAVASVLASSGFRDMTRLAGGDPAMYAAILATNGPGIRAALDGLEGELAGLRALLADPAGAPAHFAQARQERAIWHAQRAAGGRPVP